MRTLGFQEKGASLLYMIPLERWNVERSGTSCGKSTKGRWSIPFLRIPIGGWNTE
jgi:hypothetical protein